MGPIQQHWSPSGVYDNELLIIPQHTGKLAFTVTMTVTETQHPLQIFYQPMNVYKPLCGCWRQFKVNMRTSPKKSAFVNRRHFSSTVQGGMGGQARGGVVINPAQTEFEYDKTDPIPIFVPVTGQIPGLADWVTVEAIG